MLSTGPNWTCCSSLGLERKLCAADSSHLKAGLRHRHPALVLSSWASRKISAQKPRPIVISLEPEVRQLVPSTSTLEPNKFGGGESTAWLYPVLGNKSQAENHKSPWQGEVSPESIRPCHLQSFLMLRAAAVSPHNHLDKLSEEAGLGNTGMRGEQREINTGDADSSNVSPISSKESHGRPDWFGLQKKRLYHQWEEGVSIPCNTSPAQEETSKKFLLLDLEGLAQVY